jgi:uncharacterized protein YdeI (YjbR/CyaY-like superfamily)
MHKTLRFRSSSVFRKWLATNHRHSDGVWVRFFKKHSGKPSITYKEALDEALCFGWIDAQRQPCDESSWLLRFTPRRPKSSWSRINTQHAKRLIKAGRMRAAGHAQINAAKKDGRWEAAYDSPRNSTFPADFLAALRKNKKVKTFFDSLNKANLYAISYRLQTAKKPETRHRRMKLILAMLSRHQSFH